MFDQACRSVSVGASCLVQVHHGVFRALRKMGYMGALAGRRAARQSGGQLLRDTGIDGEWGEWRDDIRIVNHPRPAARVCPQCPTGQWAVDVGRALELSDRPPCLVSQPGWHASGVRSREEAWQVCAGSAPMGPRSRRSCRRWLQINMAYRQKQVIRLQVEDHAHPPPLGEFQRGAYVG